jgi:hypothetical protein
VATALGAPLPVILGGDLVIAGALAIALSITVVPRLGWVATPSLLGALALLVRPDLAVPIFAAVTVSAFVVLVMLWRRTVRPEPTIKRPSAP